MSHHITYFPHALKVGGRWKQWIPELGHFIGNDVCAQRDALALRAKLRETKPEAIVRRFGGHVNVYI